MAKQNTAPNTKPKADIDARKLGQMSIRLRVFHDEDIAKVADTYHQWRNVNGNYTEIDGFCKAATLPEIEANNFVLSPGRNVGSEAEETDGIPFEGKMQLLTAELLGQFGESSLLEGRIKKNLESIGFNI